jgi:thiamine-phosphate pyrophosphorylase
MGNDADTHAGLARILDANLNRATEGLRFAEDLARFVLNDAGVSGAFKSIRHEVVQAVAGMMDPADMLGARDTPGDAGTVLSTPGERSRPTLAAAARAACGRAQEALRVLEESAKVLTRHEAARTLEALRYRLYTAGQRLALALMRPACPQWRLCVLVSERLCVHMPWERVVERAVLGGADCVQLREKDLEGSALLGRATRLVERCRGLVGPTGTRPHVIVNDRPDVAVLAGADGVHLGQTDLPVAAARRIVGDRMWIGVSTANLDQARKAAADGADYVGLGPMFPSGTKPKDTLAGVEYLRAFVAEFGAGDATVRQRAFLPYLAISGITAANAPILRAAGCRGIAVSNAVCGAEDPKRACEQLLGA